MRLLVVKVLRRILKYSVTITSLNASARVRSRLSDFRSTILGCRFLYSCHQCSLGPYSGLNLASLPERFAMAQAKALTIVLVRGKPRSAM